MGLVMYVCWRSFAASAKIEIGTDSTLVSNTGDPRAISLGTTVWAITINTIVLR